MCKIDFLYSSSNFAGDLGCRKRFDFFFHYSYWEELRITKSLTEVMDIKNVFK